MAILFRTTKALESEVDEYLDAVSQAALVFVEGVTNYLNDDQQRFEQHINDIDKLESKADVLRRKIENDLYQHSLIPEHRGDVLGLLETMDDVIDLTKETINQFDVEHPFIPHMFHTSFKELAQTVAHAAEAVVLATRAFFKEVRFVKDHLHKVYFYETEADKVADHLKRDIYADNELDLSQKNHLRYFASHIDAIADKAENVADRLSIYTIKRTI